MLNINSVAQLGQVIVLRFEIGVAFVLLDGHVLLQPKKVQNIDDARGAGWNSNVSIEQRSTSHRQ